ncbi:mavicyanin-like [Curcuma longa]|uniref:mavicyanin-like n=1 Tax=Curcuma longa TaxID=136217 RepID=UPI003D9DBF19
MDSVVVLVVVVAAALVCASPCRGYVFYVGGRDGWVEHPRESYSSWAGRNRFQVNDTLVFRYQQGNDSVLVVTEAAFDSCNATDPGQNFTDGSTSFLLGRSGPFFFISGASGHCDQGQKLVVVVLAIRNHTTGSPPPPAFPSSPPPLAPPPSSPGGSTPPPPPSRPTSSAASSKFSVGLAMAAMVWGGAFLG